MVDQVVRYHPTDLDINKLLKKFGLPAEGTRLTHEEVADVIGVHKKKSRYRTVTDQWREYLRMTNNIELGAVPGIGYQALNAAERIHGSLSKVHSGSRTIRRGVANAMRVNTEDRDLRKTQAALIQLNTAVQFAATNMAREVRLPASTASASRLPMRTPPQGA